MGIFSWFKRKESKDDDFEHILSGLETSIREHEEALAFIRQREGRSVVLFTTYSILAWLVYVLAWYFGALDGWVEDEQESDASKIVESAIKTLPVGAVPILIFFTRRIVKWWYRRKQEAENKQLTVLRKKQRDQIDKLKKLSNYDKITEMLERHGQLPARAAFGTPQRGGAINSPRPGSAFNTPAGKNMSPSQQAIIAQAQQRSIQQASGNALQATTAGKRSFPPPPPGFGRPGPPMTPIKGQQQQMGGALNTNVTTDQFAGAAPQSKGFIDKIAEALLGGENEESPASKYALICQRCFAHNGLVLKDEIMDIQFLCPKCGFFNPSRRARMTGDASAATVQNQPHRLRTTSSDSTDVNDESAILSPTLGASSESLHGRSASTSGSQLPTQDTAEESAGEAEVAEDKETSRMNADERKGSLRSRKSASGGDRMEMDD